MVANSQEGDLTLVTSQSASLSSMVDIVSSQLPLSQLSLQYGDYDCFVQKRQQRAMTSAASLKPMPLFLFSSLQRFKIVFLAMKIVGSNRTNRRDMTNDGRTIFVKGKGTTGSFNTVSYRNRRVRFQSASTQQKRAAE